MFRSLQNPGVEDIACEHTASTTAGEQFSTASCALRLKRSHKVENVSETDLSFAYWDAQTVSEPQALKRSLSSKVDLQQAQNRIIQQLM